MRLVFLTLVVAFLGAASCTTVVPNNKEPQGPALPKPEPPKPEPPQVSNEAEALIQYAAYLRRLNGTDMNREHETMKQNIAKAKTDLNRAQLAMIYALPGLPLRDDAKALAILDPLGKEASSATVRNFALLLLSLVADNRRLDDTVQSLNTKLKDEQKQSAELQQKLEALKSIEKSLSERDRGKAPAPTTPPKK